MTSNERHILASVTTAQEAIIDALTVGFPELYRQGMKRALDRWPDVDEKIDQRTYARFLTSCTFLSAMAASANEVALRDKTLAHAVECIRAAGLDPMRGTELFRDMEAMWAKAQRVHTEQLAAARPSGCSLGILLVAVVLLIIA